MATLPAANRFEIFERTMRLWSNRRQTVTGVTNSELETAIDTVVTNFDVESADNVKDWFPEPARSQLSLVQMQEILAFIAIELVRVELGI